MALGGVVEVNIYPDLGAGGNVIDRNCSGPWRRARWLRASARVRGVRPLDVADVRPSAPRVGGIRRELDVRVDRLAARGLGGELARPAQVECPIRGHRVGTRGL